MGTSNGQCIPTRRLGSTGVDVSMLALGGFHISVPPLDEGIRLIHTAIDNGITFMDNAWEYADHESERRMGIALAQDGYRDKVFLMTKNCAHDRTAANSMVKLEESLRFGRAVRNAIEQRYDGNVAVFASGSLSHHFADNGTAPDFMHKVYDPFLEMVDHRVVELWQRGDWPAFVDMLPMYADKCWGEGGMHDTAMLLGLLGGRDYASGVEIITPYFGSSGTGQINAIFPVTPLL